MKRRELLQKSMIAASLLSVFGSGFLVLKQGSYDRSVYKSLSTLEEASANVLEKSINYFLPFLAQVPVQQLVLDIDFFLTYSPKRKQQDFNALLLLLENAFAAFLMQQRPRLFTESSFVERAELLNGWRDSSLHLFKSGFMALKKIIYAVYYSKNTHAIKSGYPGPRFFVPHQVQRMAHQNLSEPYKPKPTVANLPKFNIVTSKIVE